MKIPDINQLHFGIPFQAGEGFGSKIRSFFDDKVVRISVLFLFGIMSIFVLIWGILKGISSRRNS